MVSVTLCLNSCTGRESTITQGKWDGPPATPRSASRSLNRLDFDTHNAKRLNRLLCSVLHQELRSHSASFVFRCYQLPALYLLYFVCKYSSERTFVQIWGFQKVAVCCVDLRKACGHRSGLSNGTPKAHPFGFRVQQQKPNKQKQQTHIKASHRVQPRENLIESQTPHEFHRVPRCTSKSLSLANEDVPPDNTNMMHGLLVCFCSHE